MYIRSLLVTYLVLCCAGSVEAQLFGPRSVGRNSRGSDVTVLSNAGTVTENRRFVRGSRAVGDFVGSDKGEAAAFVGNTQAVNDGTVTSSVTGLREQATMRVNRPLTIRRTGLYAPRMTIGFEVPIEIRRRSAVSNSVASNSTASSTNDVATVETFPVSLALQQVILRHGLQISPSPKERGVVLTGNVPTEHDRRIAELLASFEPGLESVKNDLRIVPSPVNPRRAQP